MKCGGNFAFPSHGYCFFRLCSSLRANVLLGCNSYYKISNCCALCRGHNFVLNLGRLYSL